MKKKYIYSIVLGVICCIFIYFLINILSNYFAQNKLIGKWYLYNGNDITTESNLSDKVSANDYMDITKKAIKEYQSNGKNGVSSYKIEGSKLYSGDAICNYKITKVGEYKVLTLNFIGYNMGNNEKYLEDVKTYTYIFNYYQ